MHVKGNVNVKYYNLNINVYGKYMQYHLLSARGDNTHVWFELEFLLRETSYRRVHTKHVGVQEKTWRTGSC